MKKKWIAYGVTGVVGVSVLAGGAVATAASMDLRTAVGDESLPALSTTQAEGVTGAFDTTKTVALRTSEAGTSASIVTNVSPDSAPTPNSPVSPQSAPTPDSPPSPVSVPSPATPPSPASPASPPSANSPDSPASIDSADSD